jgi:hypothetical protein
MVPAKALLVGGTGSAPTLEQVTDVAVGQNVEIVLDTAGADRLRKESPPPKAFEPEPAADHPAAASAAAQMSPEQSRAIVFVRLLSLMNGKTGVRLQVAEFLKQVLNGGGALPLPAATEREIMGALADAIKGPAPPPCSPDAAPPGLSAAERVVLTSGGAASAGVGALVVSHGRALVGAATAVAALSCEAFGAAPKPFDADVVEAGGHKAAVAAADQLRGLLDGSQCLGTRKGATVEQLALFSGLPEVRLPAGIAWSDRPGWQLLVCCIIYHVGKASPPHQSAAGKKGPTNQPRPNNQPTIQHTKPTAALWHGHGRPRRRLHCGAL